MNQKNKFDYTQIGIQKYFDHLSYTDRPLAQLSSVYVMKVLRSKYNMGMTGEIHK